MAREPGYCLHKPTGQAYVRFKGKPYYLGEYGSEQSKERYNRLKAEWLLNRNAPKFQTASTAGPFMSDLCLAFLEHAKVYYSTSNEYNHYKLACGPVSELYATMPVKDFGTEEFEACQEWWKKSGDRSRYYINRQMQRLIRILQWGVKKRIVPPGTPQALSCVDPLKAGRDPSVREAEPIMPVEYSVVEATLPFLTPVVADMVQLQHLTAGRPGEICRITPAMVDRSRDIWQITLTKHKNAWRGKSRTLYLGEKAQQIISKYLLRAANAPCFSPIESERQRLDMRSLKPSGMPRKPCRAPREAFTGETYAKSIRYACRRAFPAPKSIKADKVQLAKWNSEHAWSPNQLRHARATELRNKYGLEASQVSCGHSSLSTTQIYAKAAADMAIQIAREVG